MGEGQPELGLVLEREQVIGKVRLAATARRNHWWNVPLSVSPRGLTTGLLHLDDTDFDLELDVVGPGLVGRNPLRPGGAPRLLRSLCAGAARS
jgi:hypothetical protein